MCSLCLCNNEELTHLDLYVTGSEGVWVCLPCRMELTNLARAMKTTAARVKVNTIKELRK